MKPIAAPATAYIIRYANFSYSRFIGIVLIVYCDTLLLCKNTNYFSNSFSFFYFFTFLHLK